MLHVGDGLVSTNLLDRYFSWHTLGDRLIPLARPFDLIVGFDECGPKSFTALAGFSPKGCHGFLYVLGSKLPLFPYNRGWSSTH